MRDKLFRKGLVYGILMILILLNFMPTTGSDNISLKKKFDMPNAEDEEYNDFPYFNYYRNSHDVTENQLQYNLPETRSYSLYHRRIFRDQLKKGMPLNMQDDLTRRKSINRELTLEGLRSNGDYTPHDPIHIYSDDDFTVENGVTGGSGTENDPYIIEGWEIDTNGFAAINIRHTTAYFVVRNCLLKNANYGISLWEIPVGSITDCHILFNFRGILIFDSFNIVLRDNTIYDNDYNIVITGLEMGHYYHDIDTSNTCNGKPIYYLVNESGLVFDESYDIGFLGLVGCEDILVTDVSISDLWSGIKLAGSSNITISSSTITQCFLGIDFFESTDNLIKDCNLIDSGIYLVESPNNVLRNNSLSESWGFGVVGYTLDAYYQDIDTSNYVNGKPIYFIIEEDDSTFNESNVGFLALVNCNNMVVEDVEVSNNCHGMLLAGTKGTVNNCKTSYNEFGLVIFGDCELLVNNFETSYCAFSSVLVYASNVEFINCDFAGFLGCIYTEYSHMITIKDCIFRDSMYNAIIMSYSWDNNIVNNEFSIEMGINIVLHYYCWENTIKGNNFMGSTGVAVELGSHHNTICYNKISGLENFGIFIYYSNDNIVHHNKIYNMGSAGIDITSSEGNNIYKNNIYNNTIGLDAYFCTEVNAINNWWGSKDGPSGIGPGNGDSIKVHEATVLYEPWLEDPVVIGAPPEKPSIDGPARGAAGVEHCWTFSSVDPDGDDVMYIIDWDDGETTETECYPSGLEIEECHTYAELGTYVIRVKAKDCPYGLVGPEGTLTVQMPRNRVIQNTMFQWFLEQFPILRLL